MGALVNLIVFIFVAVCFTGTKVGSRDALKIDLC